MNAVKNTKYTVSGDPNFDENPPDYDTLDTENLYVEDVLLAQKNSGTNKIDLSNVGTINSVSSTMTDLTLTGTLSTNTIDTNTGTEINFSNKTLTGCDIGKLNLTDTTNNYGHMAHTTLLNPDVDFCVRQSADGATDINVASAESIKFLDSGTTERFRMSDTLNSSFQNLDMNTNDITNVGTINTDYLYPTTATSSTTNFVRMDGTSNEADRFIRFRNGGSLPKGRAGCCFSDVNDAHWFMFCNTSDELTFNRSTQNSETPDVDNSTAYLSVDTSGQLNYLPADTANVLKITASTASDTTKPLSSKNTDTTSHKVAQWAKIDYNGNTGYIKIYSSPFITSWARMGAGSAGTEDYVLFDSYTTTSTDNLITLTNGTYTDITVSETGYYDVRGHATFVASASSSERQFRYYFLDHTNSDTAMAYGFQNSSNTTSSDDYANIAWADVLYLQTSTTYRCWWQESNGGDLYSAFCSIIRVG